MQKDYVRNSGVNAAGNTGFKLRDMVTCGLLIAMVFIATAFINIRLPFSINGGLIHLGNVALFLSAIIFGKKKGAIAGAFGMALFDVLSPYAIWAPFTFVIRGVMGYIIGSVSHAGQRKGQNALWNWLAILLGGVWMVAGYYGAEGLIYGNWISPVTSIPGNIVQIMAGAFGAIPAAYCIKKFKLAV